MTDSKFTTTHRWPKDDAHYFGPWEPKSRTEYYRVCLDPECKHVETRIAPKG